MRPGPTDRSRNAAGFAALTDGYRHPGPVGAGFLLQPTGLAALWSLDLLQAAQAHGAPVRRLYGEMPAGRTVMDMRYADREAVSVPENKS
jgi:hypothetical protein